ncbi:sulfite exporter TauE/SafE family protein [Ramlibacter sp.]|uniref:sulfite exporter TauE/SafE family protein n=1 Tax=Ramlibacter sp. TaxID=1917967 RepID=UPI00178FB56C|nr:sulfite exporter TauE/SafE family protein [Ramlibacter sp.]MBA2672447.1 sulfite exporter TauE/SafE family protein [Ramlibacter sp.]
MTLTLAVTALLMGLAGGPHCATMCGAACSAVVRCTPQPVRIARRRGAFTALPLNGIGAFQLGRLLGYATAGAAAGFAVQSFAWLASTTAALRPVWTLLHLAILAWGLTLVLLARQPAWVDAAGRAVWQRMRPLAQAPGGVLATGALWAFMPCGLLYSALLVAALSGGPVQGAASMALFACGSGLSLGLAPGLLRRLRELGNGLRRDWGTRAAGLVLVLAAGWALWMDLAHRVTVWCGLA